VIVAPTKAAGAQMARGRVSCHGGGAQMARGRVSCHGGGALGRHGGGALGCGSVRDHGGRAVRGPVGEQAVGGDRCEDCEGEWLGHALLPSSLLEFLPGTALLVA